MQRGILVKNLRALNLPDDQLRDKLTAHFQRRGDGRGVADVFYPLDSGKDDAIVLFEDIRGNFDIIQKEPKAKLKIGNQICLGTVVS